MATLNLTGGALLRGRPDFCRRVITTKIGTQVSSETSGVQLRAFIHGGLSGPFSLGEKVRMRASQNIFESIHFGNLLLVIVQ